MSLGKEIKKSRPFESLEQEAVLNVARTADVLEREMSEVLKAANLSTTQYNVLRILRGAGGEGLACGEVADRMISGGGEMRGLVDGGGGGGVRGGRGGRAGGVVVMARITGAGVKVGGGLDDVVIAAHREQLGHLGAGKLRQLIALL